MKHYETSDGDRIRVESEAGAPSFSDDVSLAVAAEREDGTSHGAETRERRIHGVLTSATHGDEIHELFSRGERFRIVVEPAGSDGATRYDDCVLLSSSGKWIVTR